MSVSFTRKLPYYFEFKTTSNVRHVRLLKADLQEKSFASIHILLPVKLLMF